MLTDVKNFISKFYWHWFTLTLKIQIWRRGTNRPFTLCLLINSNQCALHSPWLTHFVFICCASIVICIQAWLYLVTPLTTFQFPLSLFLGLFWAINTLSVGVLKLLLQQSFWTPKKTDAKKFASTSICWNVLITEKFSAYWFEHNFLKKWNCNADVLACSYVVFIL